MAEQFISSHCYQKINLCYFCYVSFVRVQYSESCIWIGQAFVRCKYIGSDVLKMVALRSMAFWLAVYVIQRQPHILVECVIFVIWDNEQTNKEPAEADSRLSF
jgi:hypothetical protein